MPGVTISANGTPRVVTDLNGIFALNVYTGTYTLSAARPCFAFSPQTRSVTVPPGITGQDFIGRSTCVRLPLIFKNWPPLPGAPVLSPIAAPSFDSYEVTWSVPTNAVSYVLQEAANTSFSVPTTVYDGPSTVWQASGKAAGDHCYRVRASNQYGAGPWSNAHCITLVQREDDFSNPDSGWPVESDDIAQVGYTSGEYRILAKKPGYVITAGPSLPVADFRCQVDARNAAHIDGAYGIAFAASDTGFYLYEVGYGQFRLERYQRWGGTWTTLIPQQQHPAIHQGKLPNQLAVIRRGTTITLFVNGVQVAAVSDAALGAGNVELAAAGANANYDVRFDNFQLAYAGGLSQSASSWGNASGLARQ